MALVHAKGKNWQTYLLVWNWYIMHLCYAAKNGVFNCISAYICVNIFIVDFPWHKMFWRRDSRSKWVVAKKLNFRLIFNFQKMKKNCIVFASEGFLFSSLFLVENIVHGSKCLLPKLDRRLNPTRSVHNFTKCLRTDAITRQTSHLTENHEYVERA